MKTERRSFARLEANCRAVITNLTLESEAAAGVLLDVSPDGITCRTALPIRPGDALEVQANGLIFLGEAIHSAQLHNASSASNTGVHLIHRIRPDDVERCRAQFDD